MRSIFCAQLLLVSVFVASAGAAEAPAATSWLAERGLAVAPSDGLARVAARIRFPGRVMLTREGPLPCPLPARATVSLRLPADAPSDVQVTLFLKDKDGIWFQVASTDELARGEWQSIGFDVGPSSARVEPEGHEATWNAYYAARMAVAGIQLFSAQPWAGVVEVGDLEFAAGEAGEPPLCITGFRTLTEAPKSFQRFELAFDLPGAFRNPFDPDEMKADALFTSPSGRKWAIPCFYQQPFRRELGPDKVERVIPSGRGSWIARFTPLEAGEHTWKLRVRTRRGSVETREHAFRVEPGTPHGFVRVSAKDPRYLETADGAFFYPIGLNIHAPFDTRCAKMLGTPVLPNRGTFAYDDYFAKMARQGHNAVIVWMSNWWVSIEWTAAWPGFRGLNDYHLGNAWRIDYLLDAAERHGICVLLVLDNHGKLSAWLDTEWPTNPYNAQRGGPCPTPEDFLTSARAFEVYRKRLRYIVARWSSHPSLLGYELVSELNLVGTTRAFRGHTSHAQWVRRVCAALAELDPYRRPTAVQYSNDWQSVDENVASLPALSFVVGDVYKPGGTIIPLMIETAERNGRFRKPTFSAEFGGNWNGTTPARLHADLHAGLWANAMTGTAGAPFFWWFDYVDRYDLYREHQALARFLAGEDRRGLRLRTLALPVTQDGKETADLGAVALAGDTRADLWVYDMLAAEIMPEPRFARPHARGSLVLPGLRPGRYRVEFWDTSQGAISSRQTATATADGLRLDLPDFTIDIAAKLRPLEEDKP